MQMVLEMDAGAILWQKRTPISSEDTGGSLEDRLAVLGATALGEALAAWREGMLVATEQDPRQVTFAPPVQKEAGRIDWRSPAAQLERAVRAYDPWPGVSTSHEGRLLKLWRTRVEALPTGGWQPGVVASIEGEGPLVATGDGGLRLLEVQAAGKRRMPGSEWLRGARVRAQDRLG
jgi:methionyl-tRNA formyltransferase